MSDLEVQNQSTDLANIDDEMFAAAQALSDGTPSGRDKISTKNSQFKLADGTVIGSTIDLVIVDYLDSNTLYPETYDPNNPKEPLCYANGSMGESLVPSSSVESPQCDNCAECPNNEFGSKGQGKACKNEYKLVVCMPGETKSTLLHLPPTARKDFEATIKTIINQVKHPAFAICTLEFDPKVSYPKPVITTFAPNSPDMAKEQFALNKTVKNDIINS